MMGMHLKILCKLIAPGLILLLIMLAISINVSAQNIRPPVANLNLDTARHDSQEAVEVLEPAFFDSSNSYDPDSENLSFIWDFGDGNTGYGPKPTHIYKKIGFYKVSLTVNDSKFNNTSSIEIIVISTKPHEPVADGGQPQYVNVSDIVHFDASNSYDPDGDSLTYIWDFGDASSQGVGETTTHIYDREGIYQITLTVKDHYHTSNYTVTINVGEGPPIIPGGPSGEDKGEEDSNLVLWAAIGIVIVILIIFTLGWVYSKRKRTGLEAPVAETKRPTSALKPEIEDLLSGKKPAPTSRVEPLPKPKRGGMGALPSAAGSGPPKGVAMASVQKGKPAAAAAKAGKGQVGRTIDVDAYRQRLEDLEKKESKKRDKLLKKQLALETKKMEKEMEKDLKDLGMEF